MCTVFTLKDNLIGRNLDLSYHYKEEIVLAPRNVSLTFHHEETIDKHYAFIGIATKMKDIPLFYEAMNEHGLFVAGLNFPNNCKYQEVVEGEVNVCPFELIPYLLSQYTSVKDVRDDMNHIHIIDEAFSDMVPNSPLHFYISDEKEAMVVECMKDGMHVYNNEFFAMTNNPPFNKQLEALKDLKKYSNAYIDVKNEEDMCVGYGAYGLLGDSTSTSRFIQTAFLREYEAHHSRSEGIMHAFRILDRVSMVKGSVLCKDGSMDYTVYSSVYDASNFKLYYKGYDACKIEQSMFKEEDVLKDVYMYEPFKIQTIM